MLDHQFLRLQAERYVALRGKTIVVALGDGTDGVVFRTDQKSAIKAVAQRYAYDLEVESYQRLKANGITKIRGFNVPLLLDHDDELQVFEMEIVTAPYVLDFGKVYLDIPPYHTDEVWQDWEEDGRMRFDHRWEEVKSVLRFLESLGIYYQDPKPGNIMFADWGTTLDEP